MSADLQWSIIRNNSAFIVRSLGTTLSRDPNNISAKNSFKATSVVNKRIVGIKAAEKGVIMTTKSKGKLIETRMSRGSRRTMKAIKAATVGSFYRPDLSDAAMRKASVLLRSQKSKGAAKRRSRKPKN
eukprot:sb/3475374/